MELLFSCANSIGDMTKDKNNYCIVFKVFFDKLISFFEKRKNFKIEVFIFFTLSPRVLKLKRCVISHSKALDKSF